MSIIGERISLSLNYNSWKLGNINNKYMLVKNIVLKGLLKKILIFIPII